MNETTIQLAHGGGGRLARDLIREEIVARFGDGPLRTLPDGATLPRPAGRLVFTTDSFVVQPLEFPGGNVGHLAVHGTVNDLAVCGARPRWLSLGLIIEEGLPLATLRRVLDAVRDATRDCGVVVATGDTKVVGKGQCDGLFMNTAGIGELIDGFDLAADRIREGDAVLVSGPLADHGMAVLACREGIGIRNGPRSDCAPVHRLVLAIQPQAQSVRFMRDPTRGGAAAVLNEMVEDSALRIVLREADIPLSAGTQAVAELLGLDPLHVASEGRVILACDAAVTNEILAAWRARPEGRGAALIGHVAGGGTQAGRVVLQTCAGGHRLVDVPRGELLPEDLLMHELSIAQAIVEQVAQIAREHAGRILSVTVSVGQLSGVDGKALDFAFPLAAEGTPAAGAKLIIEPVSAQALCRSCGREFEPDFLAWVCDRCGASGVEVKGGRDLLIKSVEIGVEPVARLTRQALN